MDVGRARLELMAIVVGWRDVVADVRAGRIPHSRESMERVTDWALRELDRIERPIDADPAELTDIDQRIREARSEVQGAT
jgi:hypothetical protein